MSYAAMQATGLKELESKLGQLIARARSGELAPALEVGANIIAERARELVHVKSGETRDSIYADITEVAPDHITAVVVAETPYSRRLELGFSGRDSLGRLYHQPPYPFLRPALHGSLGAVRQAMLQELLSFWGG